MTQTDFTRENKLPLSAVFYLIIVSMKRAVKELWGLIGIAVLSKNIALGLFWRIIFILVGIVFFGLLRGVLMYLNFSYKVQDDELIVKKGAFKKTTLSIPLHKIQNISNTQGFWLQILDITTLSVDTAGSNKNELEIFLDLETSDQLKEFLIQSRVKTQLINADDEAVMQIETAEDQELRHHYQYDTRQLLLAAISRNHLKGISIMLAVFFTFFNQLSECIQQNLLEITWSFVPDGATFMFWVTVFVLILIVSVLINIVHTCMKYYNLNVKLFENNIAYNAGLVKQIQQLINLDKIQVIEETRNVFEKLLKTSSLKIHQFLSFGEKSKNEVQIFMPGFQKSTELTNNIYHGLTSDNFSEIHSKKNFFFRNLYFYSSYPVIIFSALAFYDIKFLFLIPFLLVFTGVAAWLRYQKSKAEIGNQYLRVKAGVFGNKISTLKIRNIQSVKLRQSIFQEQSKTASLSISTRWDSLRIPFIDENEAKKILDYLLYKIES